MEDGEGACAFLAQAAAALTVLTLLPVAVSGTAPSHASAALRSISVVDPWDGPIAGPAAGDVDWSTGLFASFTYTEGQVVGHYMQFEYDEAEGGTIYAWFARGGWPPVLFMSAIRIEAFMPVAPPSTEGPTFTASGYLVDVIAHDDPTGLLEIRNRGVPRTVTLELPASATNISQSHTPASSPVSSLTYSVGSNQARLLLGEGSFVVDGTTVTAHMASLDLLLFKAVPAFSPFKAEWKAVLDAIASGAVVAEIDLVARRGGGWMENLAQYRVDVAAAAVNVIPRNASVFVTSPRPISAVVLLGFDSATMPLDPTDLLEVHANGFAIALAQDTLATFYAPLAERPTPMYSILPLPETILAVYLPSLTSVAVEVRSLEPPPPPAYLDVSSQIAMVAALAVVSVAAALIFRRRPA